jgi:gliding motility-associated-like protein
MTRYFATYYLAGRRGGALLLLCLLMGTLAARAQNACPAPAPANCPEPFRVVDVGTGQEVRTLQVGCPVSFVQAPCRPATASALLYYQVVKGTNAIPVNCLPTTAAGVATYTPTAADVGPVTVFELSNVSTSTGATGVAYIRNYQVINPIAPAFSVAACAGSTALLTITDAVFDQYVIQVNGGAAQTLTSRQPVQVTIVPGVANTFALTGSFAGSGCGTTSTQTITLPLAQTPTLTRLTRMSTAPTGGLTQFNFSQVPEGFTYTLQAQTPGQPYQTVAGTPGSVGTNVAVLTLGQVSVGRYRLLRTDACGNTALSNEVPTVALSGSAANGRNVLSFSTYGPVAPTSYTLIRSDGVAIAPLAGSLTTYEDANVQCGRAYAYRLTATLPGGGISESNTVNINAQSSTPPPTPLVVPSFDLRNGVVVTALPGAGAAFAAGGQVVISRQAGGAAPTPYPTLRTGRAGVASRAVRDSTTLATLLAALPCYTATLRDTCGNVSAASPSACPALLTVEAADPDGLTARLRWSAFQGPGSPAAGATYRVLTIGADGTVLATSASTTALTYIDAVPPLDRQVLRYRVEASGAGLPAGIVSYSNVSMLTRRPRFVMPTAFTPNGDGLNDILELKGRYLQNFTFIVVDRNGQEVFRATDRAQTWDGTINGHAPVNGAYVWRLDLQGEDGQNLRQTGTISILK